MRLVGLDYAKGIAIILIVWAHADIKMDPALYATDFKFIHSVIYSFHLYTFFVIAGIAAKLSMDRITFDFGSYMRKLLKRLLIPFYTLSSIFLLLNVSLPPSLTHAPSLKAMIMSLTFMQTQQDYLPSGVLWFLFVLCACALVHVLMIKIIRINIYAWLGIALSTSLAASNLGEIYLLGFGEIARNIFFYVFGYSISDYYVNGRLGERFIDVVVFLAFWLLGFVLLEKGYYACRIITGVAGALVLLWVTSNLFQVKAAWVLNKIRYLGRNTMEIYVLHMPVFVIIFNLLHTQNNLQNWAGLLIAVIAGLACPLLIAKALRLLPRVYTVMFGSYPHAE